MLVITLLLLSAGALGRVVEFRIEDAEALFEKFIVDFERNYETVEEKQTRFEIFKERLEEINLSNKQHGYNVMGINVFADKSNEEIRKNYLGFKIDNLRGDYCPNGQIDDVTAPDSVDWRAKGVVAPIKDQGGCGSCWAFSTVANVESQYAIKHNQLVTLSEQQLLDCDKRNEGCDGGFPPKALVNLADPEFGGLMSDAEYAYKETEDTCRFNKSRVVAHVSGCEDYTKKSDEDLKVVLATRGPLSIALAADPLFPYTGGVFDQCDPHAGINHALLLVGYGTDKQTNKPYWLIKNSWGTGWGERGYLRMVMGNPACKVSITMVSLSIVV